MRAEIGKSPEATIYDMGQTFLLADLKANKHGIFRGNVFSPFWRPTCNLPSKDRAIVIHRVLES